MHATTPLGEAPSRGNKDQRARLETGHNRSWVCVEWQPVGADLVVWVTGGSAPHIGAVATAYVQNNKVVVSTASVPGHKETELAEEFAKELCHAGRQTVLASCGIHIDNALPQEIALLCENACILKNRLLKRIYDEQPA